jgi:threonine/homoserine/homoserine lactone efflux protein
MALFTLEYFIKGIFAGLLISVPLGPIGVLLIQRTVNKGVRSGFISGLGVATADTLFAIIASFGLTFLTNFFITQQTSIKLIGGIILLFMGIRLLSQDPEKYRINCQDTYRSGLSHFGDFISMFILTITNPLAILLYGTVFTLLGLGITNHDPRSAFILIFGIYVGATVWWLVLSSGVNLYRHKIDLKKLSLINKITGIVVIAIAIFGAISIFMS